jgi:hypothetical protein
MDDMNFVLVSLEFLMHIVERFKVKINSEDIKIIENLIEYSPSDSIYTCLLHLHPNPQHNFLLPYIEGGPMSLPALTLLMNSNQDIEEVSRDKVFECLFKLLDCHLW